MKEEIKNFEKSLRRTRKAKKKWLKGELKLLKRCWRYIYNIGAPMDKEDKALLRDLIKVHDESLALIEKDFIGRSRGYLGTDKEE